MDARAAVLPALDRDGLRGITSLPSEKPAMQGYVLTFRPTTSSGTIVTDGDGAYRFELESGGPLPDGGDLVSFEPAGGATAGHRVARDVRVISKWPDLSVRTMQADLKAICTSLRIEPTSH
jgi:hypothetical protein